MTRRRLLFLSPSSCLFPAEQHKTLDSVANQFAKAYGEWAAWWNRQEEFNPKDQVSATEYKLWSETESKYKQLQTFRKGLLG